MGLPQLVGCSPVRIVLIFSSPDGLPPLAAMGGLARDFDRIRERKGALGESGALWIRTKIRRRSTRKAGDAQAGMANLVAAVEGDQQRCDRLDDPRHFQSAGVQRSQARH